MTTGAVEEFYRFQNPSKWYFVPSKMPNAVYKNLHGKQILVPGTEVSLSLEHVEKERSWLTIHWLPATYTEAAVKVVVTALSGDNQPVVFRIKDKREMGRPMPSSPLYSPLRLS